MNVENALNQLNNILRDAEDTRRQRSEPSSRERAKPCDLPIGTKLFSVDFDADGWIYATIVYRDDKGRAKYITHDGYCAWYVEEEWSLSEDGAIRNIDPDGWSIQTSIKYHEEQLAWMKAVLKRAGELGVDLP